VLGLHHTSAEFVCVDGGKELLVFPSSFGALASNLLLFLLCVLLTATKSELTAAKITLHLAFPMPSASRLFYFLVFVLGFLLPVWFV
jgi:hypothetical protein